jgi:hypothetical protein
MSKYSIFHLQGGIGKHIAATAVARTIKNNHPDRKLIPVIFIKIMYRIKTQYYFIMNRITPQIIFIKEKN